MIIAFYVIVAFLIYVSLSIYYFKRTTTQYLREELKIITGLRNKENISDIHSNIKLEYDETLNRIIAQEKELENSLNELKEFRNELNVTYNTLVKNSSKLEYSNKLLELRVKNLSNLNHISRTALSFFDLDKIVDTMADAYFVLTPTKRLSIYLWEDGELVNKKVKGAIKFKDGVRYSVNLLKMFTANDYKKIYADLSRGITVLNDETLIISPLQSKNREIGVIYTIQDTDKMLEINSEIISSLSIQASNSIDNALNHKELLIKERISQELELASTIQKQILPESLEGIEGLDIATYFGPAKEIGGDYYDYSLKNNILSVSIADVSGKGVPAAFLMALSRSVLKTINHISMYTPSEELEMFNKIIFKDITQDMFITIMNAKYDLKSNILTYSSAGHNPIAFYNKKRDEVELCGTKGVAIGFLENYRYREHTLKFEIGDIAIFYTDGVIEAENTKRELFGVDKLKAVIKENKNLSSKELKNKILEEIKEFRQSYEQVDDITFVIIKRLI